MGQKIKKVKTVGKNEFLFCYVDKAVGSYARNFAAKKWKSYSNYVNYLIAKDAGFQKCVENSKTKARSKRD